MKETDKETDTVANTDMPEQPGPAAEASEKDAKIADLTDKWKRALAEAENARKRADMSRLDGREHGISLAVEALAPAFDAIFMALETARTVSEADAPWIKAHLEGLTTAKTAFETGLKALGVRMIAPKDTSFDPELHEAMQIQETEYTKPGNVLVLHRPGFAIGRRLIRPAHVTVSAAPSSADRA
jgi:molecular chaperone GrpE